MDTLPALAPVQPTTAPGSLWSRVLAFVGWRTENPREDLGAWDVRSSEPMEPIPEDEGVDLGADFALGSFHSPRYDPVASLATIAAFPWVYAACIRGARDFAGLPWQVVTGWDGVSGKPSPGHPLYALLQDWSPRVTGRQAMAQLWIDHTLAGNHIAYLSGSPGGFTLQRLHPARVQIESNPKQGWGDYLYNGGGAQRRIAATAILHTRNPSWADDPRGLWGTGGIEALASDLATDKAASSTARTLSSRGRPDVIMSIKSGNAGIGDTLRKELQRRLDMMLARGGTLVVGADAEVSTPAWAPRDIEFPKLRETVREAVLAVTGVPPHLVGLPVANFAQAEAQERAYWERQRSLTEDVSDQHWRRIASLYGEDVRVIASFAHIDVLQAGRTARQQRVAAWVAMGVPLDQARQEEGFPALETPVAAPSPPPATKASPEVLRWLAKAAPVEEDVVARERVRADRWKAWIATHHAPMERHLAPVVQTFLTAQAGRVGARLATEMEKGGAPGLIQRDALDDLIAALMPASEQAALRQAVVTVIREGTLSAFTHGAAAAGYPSLAFDPITLDATVDGQLGAMVVNVTDETTRQVRAIVRAGLASGSTVAEMQAELMQAEAFSATRSLRIARTETTTSQTAGALQAYREANAAGAELQIEWLSARDSAVRPTHVEADGTVVDLGQEFTLSDGDHGLGPGMMGTAANNVNCRCTPMPVVKEP